MKDVHEITACVVDRGTFFPVAKRLARDCKKVYYHRPNGETFETFAQNCLGDGHPDVSYLHDFWPIKREIDLFVFPDCNDSGLQTELECQGHAVWGSRDADQEERMRGLWLKTCKDLGLPMPRTHIVEGLTNLWDFLSEHEDETFFVKISRYRGDMETWKTGSAAQVTNKLNCLAQKFGPFGDMMVFYVQEPVETEIEGGVDTYSIDGEYPSRVILGYERKAESYFATWKERTDMPPEIWKPSELIAPILAEYRYRNMVSTEVRVKGKESYLLDPCFRFPSPAGEEELELYENFSDILWQGAQGVLIQPKMAAKFCGEAIIQFCGDKDGWKSVRVPEPCERWVKLYACGHQYGACHFPPAQDPEAIGCAVALGDTPTEVLDNLKEIAEMMEDEPVQLKIEPLAHLFQEIEKAEDKGIDFTKQEMPQPGEALEHT